MTKKLRLSDVKPKAIKSDLDARVTVDYLYTLYPHDELIKDIKRYHAKKKIMLKKNDLLPEHKYDQQTLNIK